MVTFFYLSFTFFFGYFLQGTIWTLCIEWCFLNLIFTFFFKHFLQGIKDLRCRMITWFYLISTSPSFLSTSCQELRTSSVGWLHFFTLISTFFFKHFLPGIVGLRCIVTFFYLGFTFFFEHFLQGTMDLRHRLITSPQRHLTNSLETACEHLTIFTSPPLPLSVEYRGGFGGGVRGDVSLTDFQPTP